MGKKDFTGGLSSLLGDQEPELPKRGRPKTNKREITKSSQEGTKENETRATFVVNEKALQEIKDIAYWERKKIKEIVAEAFEDVIAKYQKKGYKDRD